MNHGPNLYAEAAPGSQIASLAALEIFGSFCLSLSILFILHPSSSHTYPHFLCNLGLETG
jgi:hypothetical protein